VFAGLAKQWPQLEEHLDVCRYTVLPPQHTVLLLDLVYTTIILACLTDLPRPPYSRRNSVLTPHTVLMRIYKPKPEHPLPLMLYFPDGGYIAGNIDTEDSHCHIFAAKTPCVVINVAYPLSTPASRRHHRCRYKMCQLGASHLFQKRHDLTYLTGPGENAPRLGAEPTRQSSAEALQEHSSPHKSFIISWPLGTSPLSLAAFCCLPLLRTGSTKAHTQTRTLRRRRTATLVCR
jgi:hypothetical protein